MIEDDDRRWRIPERERDERAWRGSPHTCGEFCPDPRPSRARRWAAFLLVLAFVLALAVPALAEPLCNISWCVDPTLETAQPGACPEGAGLDFGGNPRQIRQGATLICPAGAWGYGVTDPASGARVPVYDRLIECRELARLCPWAPIVPEGESGVPAPPVLIGR